MNFNITYGIILVFLALAFLVYITSHGKTPDHDELDRIVKEDAIKREHDLEKDYLFTIPDAIKKSEDRYTRLETCCREVATGLVWWKSIISDELVPVARISLSMSEEDVRAFEEKRIAQNLGDLSVLMGSDGYVPRSYRPCSEVRVHCFKTADGRHFASILASKGIVPDWTITQQGLWLLKFRHNQENTTFHILGGH